MTPLTFLVERLSADFTLTIGTTGDELIREARLWSSELPMKEGAVYVSSEEGQVCCRTGRGSKFWFRAGLEAGMNRLLDIIEDCERWQEHLKQASGRGCTLTELLNLSYDILPCPMFLLDSNEWCIAHSEAFDNDNIDSEWNALVRNSTSPARTIAEYNRRYYQYFQNRYIYRIPGSFFPHEGFAFNLFSGQSFCGVLVMIEYGREVSAGELEVFRILGQHIQAMISGPSSRHIMDTKEKPLMDYMMDPGPGKLRQLERSLELDQWRPEDPKQVICALPVHASGMAPSPLNSRVIFSRMEGVAATVFHTRLLLLCNLRMTANKSLSNIYGTLSQISFYAGVSSQFQNLSELPVMSRQAEIALEQGADTEGAINRYEDHVLPYYISIIGREDPQSLVHPSLEHLREYDRHHGNRLYETLFAFLRNERNIAATARELGIHRSTLIHRLERIEDIYGSDLDKPEVRILLLLSYYTDMLKGTASADL